jgi:hypothetical protein
MTKRVMHRLAKALCFMGKRSFPVLKKVSDADVKVGLVAAVLFALAYAVETKCPSEEFLNHMNHL